MSSTSADNHDGLEIRNLPPLSDHATNSSPWSVVGDSDEDGHVATSLLEPVAIIGMSCRLPGSAKDVAGFWEMLQNGRSAWTPGPGNRFNMKAFQDPTGAIAESTNVQGAHFLKGDIRAFDASFFGLNPLEVAAMDPQHRLLLEIAYESFENAGISLPSLWASKTGVYVGQWTTDYHEVATRDISDPPKYLVTGTGPAISSNRISYFFNLLGPSFTVDTGCSSSLVALHQAIHSLRSGEASQCFVGGVNLLLDPQRFVYQSKLGMFSKEGRCFSFDTRANGYGRGEGCTGVVLKPLSAALRDGDNIRAVIRNSAVNQDGRTPGLTVPSAAAQTEAIKRAYGQVLMVPEADYVEAHGTGTKVGDPIEVSAIAAAFTQGNTAHRTLPIGSVKGNIGHTEAAAGLAGLIKAVLMLEKGMIPPQANYKDTNPAIKLDEWNMRITTELERHKLRRISVNSFGYGGTNAHVILEEATFALSTFSLQSLSLSLDHTLLPVFHKQVQRVFFLNAASEKSCQMLCKRLSQYLVTVRSHGDENLLLSRLAYTLGRHSVHPHRISLLASTVEDLLQQLSASEAAPVAKCETRSQKPRVAFVFSGQGAQYAQMGQELLSYPIFQQSMSQARDQLKLLGCPWDLLEEINRCNEESRIDQPAISQPSCTAIQLALVDLLSEFGVSPSAVVGHSSGEIAAAYAVGAISFNNALAISYFRGKVTSALLSNEAHQPGAMLAVGTNPELVAEHIAATSEKHGQMRIACFNSPQSVTVSGDDAAINELKTALDAGGYFNRKLKTNGAAYHSHHMEAVEKPYAEALGGLPAVDLLKERNSRFFSTVTGHELGDWSEISTSYWTRNLLSPVLFTQALSEMVARDGDGQKIDFILELGPHSQMGGPVKQILKISENGTDIKYMSCLTRGKNAEVTMLGALSQLHMQGLHIPLDQLNRYDATHPPKLLSDLPPYPFDHDRTFWHESRVSKNYRHRKYLPHELLGTMSPEVNHLEPHWRHFLSLKQNPWLKNHVVQGQIVFPAAGYLTMAMQAMQQHAKALQPAARVESIVLRNVSIGKAILLNENAPNVEMVLSMRPQARSARESSSIWNDFRIFTVSTEDKWTEHCRGLIQAVTDKAAAQDAAPPIRDVQHVNSQTTRQVLPSKFYLLSRQMGLDWQAPFDSLSDIRTGVLSSVTTAQAAMNPATGGIGDILHPSVLDATLFQGHFAHCILEQGEKSPRVPTFIKEMRVANRKVAAGKKLVSTAVSNPSDRFTYNIVIKDDAKLKGSVIEAHGVTVTQLPGDTIKQAEDMCYKVDWVPYMENWNSNRRSLSIGNNVPSPSSGTASQQQQQHLDDVAAEYVQKALSELEPGEIADAYKQLSWRLQCLVESFSSRQRCLRDRSESSGSADIEKMLHLVGPCLANVLSQKVDLLSLISSDDICQLYNSEENRHCINQVATYCQALGRQTPRLTALVVGAGAALAAGPILEAAHSGDRYLSKFDVAGISEGQFETIKNEVGGATDAAEVRCVDLDMAQDATQQGFEEASYDLVVSAYSTPDIEGIDSVLSNLGLLLKPGGKLIMLARTRDTLHYSLLSGLCQGAGVKLAPVASRQMLLSKLEQAGLVADTNSENSVAADKRSSAVLTASRPWVSDTPDIPPVQLVSTGSMAMTYTEAGLGRIEAALRGVRTPVCDLAQVSPGDNFVVILPEVAEKLCLNPKDNDWQRFKTWVTKARAVLMVSAIATPKGHKNAHRAIWTGLARCIRQEFPHIRYITMDFEQGDILEKLSEYLPHLVERTPLFDFSRPAYEIENEFSEMDGQLHVSRIKPSHDTSDYIHRMHQLSAPVMTPFLDPRRTLTAELGVPGLLDTIRWKDDMTVSALGDDEIRLELRAASINFKDVLIASGQLPGITEMRNDCSGVVSEVGANMRQRFQIGDRVMALYSQSYTNHPVVHGDCCERVPHNLSFDEAASVPIVWATVYYSLIDIGRLVKGDKILIHSAAGAVGQAAIMLAQHIGAEIFTTVGSDSKRDLVHDKFGIPHDHIFSSRTTGFYAGVKDMTADYGVDVVLNSLSGEMFRHSCDLVAPFGRFVEIGRKDLMDDALMPMSYLLKNITFGYVDMALIIDTNKPLARRVLHDVTTLLAQGHINPVMLTSMPISDIEAAFRLIQAGKHTGKIILRVEEKQEIKAIPAVPATAKFRPDASYAVVGGFGGIGHAVIEWMADNGAKHIVCISRSGAKSQKNMEFMESIKAKGVSLIAARCDITSESEVSSLARQFEERAELFPIRGVIQSSAVFDDGLFEQMTAERWWNVLGPKVQGTKNLDNAFKDADFFVVMSSIVSLCGNDGQANYAAACCFQDELVRQRAASGSHAFSMNIGPVDDVGWLSENLDVAKEVQRRGFASVSIKQVISMLNYAIMHQPDRNDPNSSVCAISPRPYSSDSDEQARKREKRFAHIVKVGAESRATSSGDGHDALSQLDKAGTFNDAVDLVCGALLKQLGKLIATPEEMLSPANSLDYYGVDSLIAVEMRNWIVAYLKADLPLMMIRCTGSILELAKLISNESPLVGSY